MDDLDPPAGDVPHEPRLLRERLHAAERGHLVFRERDPPVRQLLHERSPAPQAGELEIESRRIEPAAERHELVLRAAAHQRRDDLQNPRVGHEALRASGVTPTLGAPDVAERDGETGDAEEIELVGDGMKHRRDGEGDERRPARRRRAARDRGARVRLAARFSTARAVRKQSRCSQAKSSSPGMPRSTPYCRYALWTCVQVVAALLVHGQDVLADADADDRVLRHDLDGNLGVAPAALRRAGLVRLDVGDRAEARPRSRAGSSGGTHIASSSSPTAAPGAFRRASTARNMTKDAASVRKPARENVRIDGRDAQQQRPGRDDARRCRA